MIPAFTKDPSNPLDYTPKVVIDMIADNPDGDYVPRSRRTATAVRSTEAVADATSTPVVIHLTNDVEITAANQIEPAAAPVLNTSGQAGTNLLLVTRSRINPTKQISYTFYY